MPPEAPANHVQPPGWGPSPAPGPSLQERPTCQRRVHQRGRRSHYSSDEIIMTGAPRPHHRNIYCIIYSSGPLVQGERTHINFQAGPSLLTRSCLLLKAEVPARFLSSFFSLLLLFFSASIRAPRPRRSALTTYSRPHLYLFHLLFSCFHTTGAAPFLGFFFCFFPGADGDGAFLEEGRGAARCEEGLCPDGDKAARLRRRRRQHKGPH